VSWVALASEGGGGGFRILWGMGGETVYRLGASILPDFRRTPRGGRLVTAMFCTAG